MDSAERLAFLQRAIEELAIDADDPRQVLDRMAGLAVPAIADACWIDLVLPNRKMQRVAVVGRVDLPEPVGVDCSFELVKAPLVEAVVDSAQRLVLTDLRTDRLDCVGMAEASGAHAHLGVLLCKGTRVLGVMSLLYLDPARHADDHTSAAADDLAKLGERALLSAQRTQRFRRLHGNAAALSRTLTRAEVAELVVAELLEAADASSVRLAVVGHTEELDFRLTVDAGDPERSGPNVPAAMISEVARTGRPTAFSSPEERRERWPDLSEANGLTNAPAALALLPITWGDGAHAVVAFAYAQDRLLDGDELGYLSELAAHCGPALERADAFEAQLDLIGRLRILAAAGEALDGPLDLDSTVERITAILAHELGDWCCVHLCSGEELNLVALAHRDQAREAELRQVLELVGATLQDRRGAGAAVRENRMDAVEDLSEAQVSDTAPTIEQLAVIEAVHLDRCSSISVPLRRDGTAAGALSVVWERPRAWRAEEVALVEEVGRRVTLALVASWELMERRAVEASLAAVASQAARLALVTSRLSQATTVEDVGECILVDLLGTLGASGGALTVLRPTGDFRHVRLEGYGEGTGTDWPEIEVKAPTLRNIALRSRRPLILTTLDELRAELPRREAEVLIALAGEVAWVTLPLISGTSPLGTLVLTFPYGYRFDGAEQDHLVAVAAEVTNALARALHHQLEHDVADTLQRALLPQALPSVAGLATAAMYLPASDEVLVGGDWYDVLALPGHRVALVVGDVAGHDLRAAGVMGHIKSQLQACLYESPSPAVALGALDELMCRYGEDSMATVACAVWDPAEASLALSLAGHPPPLLIQPGQGAEPPVVRFVGPDPGLPCGAGMRGHQYEELEVKLAPGTGLLAYTDGLVETRDRSLGERLDELRAAVEALLRTPKLAVESPDPDFFVEALARGALADLLGERERHDDVVVLSARFIQP
jgi:serine phosphatase RsbU (regulator of sigma subunit)